jgi:predicted acyltransferase
MSLDIYRGLMVAGMIVVDNPGSDEHAYWPIMHAKWNGWTPADFIFPSFLFLVGISMVYSFSARLERGESRAHILLHAFKRTLILIAIGVLVNASPIIGLDVHTWRFEGVLQRMALCYFVCAILELWAQTRGKILGLLVCLLGYWALLRFVPVPDYGMPGRDVPFLDPVANLPAWLDRKLFMGHLYDGTSDPEGLLHTIPAIASCLMGVLTGHWLRSRKTPGTTIAGMLVFGCALLGAGKLWDVWLPINKHLWTSSFVLLMAGASLIFLAFLYWIVEVKKWRGAWTMPFLVFGMNPIAGFVADSLVYGPAYTFMAKGPSGAAMNWHEAAQAHLESFGLSTANASLLYSLAALLFCWLLLCILWRRKIFLKV